MQVGMIVNLFGQVQGVGLRPWLYHLASAHKLNGTIGNSRLGAAVRIEGGESDVTSFLAALKTGPPLPALISNFEVLPVPLTGVKSLKIDGFIQEIETMEGQTHASAWSIPTDIATCDACWSDYFNPSNRFYRYPFVSCTACGPRWSILRKFPFNRETTSYLNFPLCTDCETNYKDPNDRRFHAQTICCQVCGPALSLLGKENTDPLGFASKRLAEGKIGAVKGIGGFQLMCSGLIPDAIERLRRLKNRPHQSLAIMFKDFRTFAKYGGTASDWARLKSPLSPILSLKSLMLPTSKVLAPDLIELGAMAPTTPLHYALLENCDVAVVTSANGTDHPIPSNLAELKFANPNWMDFDFILDHDREITNPIDDSVLKGSLVLRAARGLRPKKTALKTMNGQNDKFILALGADLKNSAAFFNKNEIIELPYQGKIRSLESCEMMKHRLSQSLGAFSFSKKIYGSVICDYHPETLTDGLLPESIQTEVLRAPHHEAHAHSLRQSLPVDRDTLVLTFDGTGYDSCSPNQSGGGEGYLHRSGGLSKALELVSLPLVGGDNAVHEPWRQATSFLTSLGWSSDNIRRAISAPVSVENVGPSDHQLDALAVIHALVSKGNSANQIPETTSAGRWFDAVSSIVEFGFRPQTYEAQAPIRLETLASIETQSVEPFSPELYFTWRTNGSAQIETGKLLGLIAELKLKNSSSLAWRAHDYFAQTVAFASMKLQVQAVALTGGVFQNEILRDRLKTHLQNYRIELLEFPDLVNDQCIALGQLDWYLQLNSELGGHAYA